MQNGQIATALCKWTLRASECSFLLISLVNGLLTSLNTRNKILKRIPKFVSATVVWHFRDGSSGQALQCCFTNSLPLPLRLKAHILTLVVRDQQSLQERQPAYQSDIIFPGDPSRSNSPELDKPDFYQEIKCEVLPIWVSDSDKVINLKQSVENRLGILTNILFFMASCFRFFSNEGSLHL